MKKKKDTAYFNCIAALYKQKEIKLDPHLIQCSNYNFFDTLETNRIDKTIKLFTRKYLFIYESVSHKSGSHIM